MEKIIPNGTDVLIFRDERQRNKNLNQIDFIKGIVVSSKQSDDLSYHGSPWYVQIYTILGEDGEEYIATYRTAIVVDRFIRTIDDHLEHLKLSINDNIKQIQNLEEENSLFYQKINDLLQQKTYRENNLNNEVPVLKKQIKLIRKKNL